MRSLFNKIHLAVLLTMTVGIVMANVSAQARIETTFSTDNNANGHSPLLIAQQSNDTSDDDSQNTTSKDKKSSDEMAETARHAYEEEDGKPAENWFGCPPAEEDEMDDGVAKADSGGVDKDQSFSGNCDPDAAKNKSP